MQFRNRLKGRLTSAAATVLIAASGAWAQNRIDTSGRALDANNRIGSGGFNAERDFQGVPNIGNAIVTGNVTGGAQFRGTVPYTDPRAFRGTLAGAGIDRFVADSAGATPTAGFSNAQSRRLFYGESRGVPPPPGFTQLGSTGGFVPAPAPTRIGSDLRIGSVFDTPTVLLPRPGELLMGGQLDASNNNVLISASPLYGVRPLVSGDAADNAFFQRYTSGARDRTSSDPMIRRLREELRDDSDAASDGQALASDPLQNSLQTQPLGSPLSSDVNSGQQVRQQLALRPAVQQSAQYQQLVERLERHNAAQGLDPSVTAARDFNARRRAVEEIEQGERPTQPPMPQRTPQDPSAMPGMPGDATTPGMPGSPGGPGLNLDPSAPAQPNPGAGQLLGPSRLAERAKPPMISSLATGVQAKGLEQLLKDAEALMKEQKFVAAIDKYGTAQQVAPNNPLPLLGMANAELGASFYARAETHLRQAFDNAPALMMAQYDLRQFLGEERLAFVVKDLKEIANNEKASPRPLLLLAYIAYNEGSDRMAAGYLDLAEKRTAGEDPIYKKLRDHWQLPPVTGDASELNK